MTPSGRSGHSGRLCPRVGTSSSSILRCATSWAYSLVRIDASARLTVCSGCACDVCGLGGGTHWCWSSPLPSPVGGARDFVDAGAVTRDGDREDHGSIHKFERSFGAMATENRLWGAPRIHGELLKLGVTVAERTVSRYLPDRPTAPSQTWRTFLANHLGDLAFTSTMTSSSAPGDDDVVDEDARVFPWCPAPPSRAQPCVSNPCAVVDWPSSLERTSLGCRVAQDHLHRRARTRSSSGKDCGSKPTNSLRPLAGSWIASAVLGVSRCNRSSTSSEGTDVDFLPPAKRTSATDFHSARNIGEAHPVVISS
jgi:hypothetical protein